MLASVLAGWKVGNGVGKTDGRRLGNKVGSSAVGNVTGPRVGLLEAETLGADDEPGLGLNGLELGVPERSGVERSAVVDSRDTMKISLNGSCKPSLVSNSDSDPNA